MSRNPIPARRRAAGPADVPVLVVTADDDLLAALLPLAAAADVAPSVARDPLTALRSWPVAPVVLVGADLAEEMLRVVPEARPRCFVVTGERAPHELFRTALRLGAEQVVELPGAEPWLVELLADLTERQPGRARVIGVIGGSGGAGATTFACALGQWAARSGDAVVIDCDPQGPGLDRMLGVERRDGFRWDALCQTTGRLSARALREALPRSGALGVLSWYVDGRVPTLQAFAAREALSAARRGHAVVVVDLPRSPDALVDELAARCDLLLVVTVASVVGVAGAARMRARFAGHPDVAVVLRGEAFGPDEVRRAVGLPVLVQMRDQRGLAESNPYNWHMGIGTLEAVASGACPENESARPERQLRTGWTHREGPSMSTDSIPEPATPDDVRWWWSLAPTLRWTFASTMPDVPHWYVRGGTTPGFTTDDSERVARIVRTFGEPGKFYRQTNLYLFTEDRVRKVWCMHSDPPRNDNVRIVNLAYADQVHGPQTDFDEQRLAELRLGGAR